MKQEIKVTRSKHKLRPNFTYKGKKYSTCMIAMDNELTLEIAHKDKHGNCTGITLFALNESIKNFLERKEDLYTLTYPNQSLT